jgi:ABC-type multidrug transport system fused ATPase/permease subunit
MVNPARFVSHSIKVSEGNSNYTTGLECEKTVNSETNNFSWKGLAALIVILIIVSIIAFLLSSIEGFLAGVVVIFIGFLISFFRDDLKRALGLSTQHKEPAPVAEVEEDPLEKLDKMINLDIDKKIAKERQSIAKTIAKYNEKPKKQQKLGLEIVKEATALLALLDQAKSQAIQSSKPDLVAHYEQIAVEIEEIREKYRQ